MRKIKKNWEHNPARTLITKMEIEQMKNSMVWGFCFVKQIMYRRVDYGLYANVFFCLVKR